MTSLHRWGLPLAIILGALVALCQVNQHLILASDNASYIVLGQALALGRGYVMANEPTAPAMNLYPFGYPALLAAILRLTGAAASPLQAVVPMKLVAVAFFLASLPVIYVVVRRRHGHLLATLTTLLFAANPSVLTLATEILSETPFVFFTLWGLAIIDLQPRWSARRQATAGDPGLAPLIACAVLLGAAYYMRTAALAVLAAAPLYLLIKRQARAGIVLGILVVALALPWLARSSAPPTPETPFFARSYLHQVLAAAPYSAATVTPLGLAARIAGNSAAYAFDILPATLLPHLSWFGAAAPAACVAIGLLCLLGFAVEIRRGVRVFEVAIAAYWLSLSLFVWVLGFRYIILIVPFAYLYLLSAIGWGIDRLKGTRANAQKAPIDANQPRATIHVDPPSLILAAVATVLLLSCLAIDVRRVERNLRVARQQTLAEVYGANGEWARWLEAVAWIQQKTPQDAVILGRKPDLLYLLSGRLTVEYPYSQDTSLLMSTVHRNAVSYVLEDAFTWTRSTETYLAPAMRGQISSFTLVHETPSPPARVWAVVRR